MKILPIYAALLTLLYLALSIRTVRARRRARVAVGDGGNPQLLRAMRVHANFAEYVPLALLLLALLELRSAPAWLLHGLGLLLLLARLAHAYGVSQVKENFRFRVVGVFGSLATLGVAAAWLLVTGLF